MWGGRGAPPPCPGGARPCGRRAGGAHPRAWDAGCCRAAFSMATPPRAASSPAPAGTAAPTPAAAPKPSLGPMRVGFDPLLTRRAPGMGFHWLINTCFGVLSPPCLTGRHSSLGLPDHLCVLSHQHWCKTPCSGPSPCSAVGAGVGVGFRHVLLMGYGCIIGGE